MKKSIFLFFAAILCAMSANAAYYFHGSKTGSDWPGKEMTKSADGYYYYYQVTSGTHEFKITSKSDWSGTEYTTVLSKYNGTDVAVTGGNGSNCKITNCTSTHYVIIYPKSTLINNTTNYYVCASTTLPNGFGAIHFKHPWNGGSWTYQTATNNGDGTFSYVGKYGNAGVNWCVQKNGTGEKYIGSPTLVGSPATGDDCTFTFNGADQTITITKKVNKNIGDITITMNCTQQPKIFFWEVEGKTCAAWPGEDMVATGANTYTYTFEDVDVDLGVNYKINLKAVNENEWETGDLHTTTDITHTAADLNIPTIGMHGNFIDGWKDTEKFTVSDDYTSATLTLEGITEGDHEFGMQINGVWTSNGKTFTRDANSAEVKSGSGNLKLTADYTGNYIFTYTYKTQTLEVTYPELPTPEYKDITVTVYAKEVPNIWWWNGGDKCADADDAYDWNTAPAMEAVVIDGNTWYQKKFENVDIAKGGIKFKLKSQDQSQGSSELQTTEDKCYDARVITGVTETPCGVLPEGEIAKLTYYVEVPEGTNDCYIAGEMNGWTLTQMNKVDDRHYTIIIEGATTEHKYKYASGPDSDWKYVEVKADGSDVSDRTYNANDVVEKWKAVYDPSAPVYKYYIVGSMNSWNQSSADHGMTDDDEDGIYEKKLTLKNNDEFKVKGNDWYGFDAIEGAYVETSLSNESDRNIKITLDADKEVTVKFNSETKKITFDNLTEKAPVVEDFSNQPSVLYFHPSNQWKEGDARFAAYFFGTEEKWVSMTDVDNDGIYEVVNDKKNKNVIFCRMNPANNENKWGENGSHKWNQSADLEIPTTTYLNYWMVAADNTTWDNPEGKWMMLIGSGDNSEALTAADGQTVEDVYVNRSFTAGQLYTIALPFDLSDALTKTHFGNTVSVIKFVQLDKDENGDLVLLFENALGMGAGKPYVITPSNTIDGFTVNNVVINNTPNNVQQTTTGAQVTMEAVLSASKGATTNGRYWLASDTYLYNVSSALKSLRAVFNIQSNKANVRARVAFGENVETGVDNIITTDAPVKAIVNGQLIIIRDGVKYNVQGQKL